MMRTSDPGSKKGFSLLELIVILMLVALAAGVVMPSFSRGLRGLEMLTAGRDLMTRMRHARSQAIAKQKIFRIILRKEEDETVPDYYVFADEFEQQIRKFDLPEGVSVQAEQEFPVRINFYANGRSSGGLFALKRETGREMRISVDPITGFPKVLKETQP
jgi:type II secretory pathway component PulJ